jgi:hypothetical protein
MILVFPERLQLIKKKQVPSGRTNQAHLQILFTHFPLFLPPSTAASPCAISDITLFYSILIPKIHYIKSIKVFNKNRINEEGFTPAGGPVQSVRKMPQY